MLISLILLALSGHVSNDPSGMVGIRVGWDNRIERVHKNSPAYTLGLQKGDKINDVDGKGPNYEIRGEVGEVVRITVSRPEGLKTYWIRRVSAKEIKKLESQWYRNCEHE